MAGLWLVIDLFSGSGGLLVALSALGVRFIAVCAESDDLASAAPEAAFTGIIPVGSVEEVRASMVAPLLRKRKVAGVLVAGGAPCQPNSTLNKHSKELEDPRAELFRSIPNLAADIRDLPEAKSILVLELLENPVGRPAFQQVHQQALGGAPLLIDAGIFGWVTRRRLYYGRGPAGTFAQINAATAAKILPQGASISPIATGRAWPVIKWKGKPVPSRVGFSDGFKAPIDPAAVVADGGVGAMYTFTRAYPHPADQPASREAMERFVADKRRFPTTAYEERYLAVKGEGKEKKLRPLTAAERAAVHCYPPSILEEAYTSGGNDTYAFTASERENRHCSLIGNGFHIPSVMVVLILLGSLQGARANSIPKPLSCANEASLRGRVAGTAFEPDACLHFPGVLTAHDVVTEIFYITGIDRVMAEKKGWAAPAAHPNVARAVGQLQIYWVDRSIRGLPPGDCGPQVASQVKRAQLRAILSDQRGPSNSKRGMPMLVQAGIGKHTHMEEAASLKSPYALHREVEDDVGFAARVVATFWSLHTDLESQAATSTGGSIQGPGASKCCVCGGHALHG